ncbi:hypothetical protein PHISCL_02296 [Aspergillus sclerotialis]|uniref:Uncharacterized protein n=1 Tax=Aspergillus sclerotialis TaxID=2070753 RepID=A0A3A3A600_9EURO|nr:hypothetical protein PHISCL_02296 [Aspergillus sclerotialis]
MKHKYLQSWHPKHRVPIVDGKFQNLETGEIEESNLKITYSGPPAVHVTWFNVEDDSTFIGSGAAFAATVDDVLIAIMGHVRDGAYSIVSLNATEYAVIVVCLTSKSQEEVSEYVHRMKEELSSDVVLPPEEIAAIEEWDRARAREAMVDAGASTTVDSG